MKVPSMDFRGQKFVNENGELSAVAQGFFDLLETLMSKNIGDEGLVMPSQSEDDIEIIQNNAVINPNGETVKTCDFGTMIIDQTNNLPMIALDDGSGNPIFKQIVTM